jgi:hypothetical protein
MQVYSGLKKGTKIRNTKFLRHCLELFMGGSYGNSHEIQITGSFVGSKKNNFVNKFTTHGNWCVTKPKFL